MILSTKQRQQLKQLAHHLKPIIMIGSNGLTEGIIAETEIALNHHELIKIKVQAEDRETKLSIMKTIINETHSVEVQILGKILTVYRPSKEQKIKLNKA